VKREEVKRLLEGWLIEGELVLPRYEDLNIVNIHSLVGEILGVSSLSPSKIPLSLLAEHGGVSKILIFIADGLGYNRLLSHIEKFDGVLRRAAERGSLTPITTTFPSTTSTAITSLFTSSTPSEHGIIGYLTYLKTYGLILNTLSFSPVYGYAPAEGVASELAFGRGPWTNVCRESGVRVSIVHKTAYTGGLSELLYTREELVTHISTSDMLVAVRRALEQPGPSLVTAYHAGLDLISHLYGPYSEESETELLLLEHSLQTLIESIPEAVRREVFLIFLSDHGQARVSELLFLKEKPEVLKHLLIPPVGDSRATFLFAKQGRAEELRGALERELAGFRVIPSGELAGMGFFGKVVGEERLWERVGDVAVLGRDKRALFYPYFDSERVRRGSHGGPSEDEMVIPLLSVRLPDL